MWHSTGVMCQVRLGYRQTCELTSKRPPCLDYGCVVVVRRPTRVFNHGIKRVGWADFGGEPHYPFPHG